jgi:uncharacterized protein YjbJ (UPF0337 family)
LGPHRRKLEAVQGQGKAAVGVTDDQLDVIAGKRDQLLGTIQEQYGISRDEAEKQIAAFENRFGRHDSSSRH